MATQAEQAADVQRLINTLLSLIDRMEYVLDRYTAGITESGGTPDVDRVNYLLNLIEDLQGILTRRQEQLDAILNPPTGEEESGGEPIDPEPDPPVDPEPDPGTSGGTGGGGGGSSGGGGGGSSGGGGTFNPGDVNQN